MRNKLLVAGTLALAMTCTTVFSSITPAVVKAASVSTVQTAENSDDYVYCCLCLYCRYRQQKIVMTTFTAMQA